MAAAVLVFGLVVTAALTLVTAAVSNRNENRLLGLQVSEAGIALGEALSTVNTPLASGAAAAQVTQGNVTAFVTSFRPYVGPGNLFAYAALCQLSGGKAQATATLGAPAAASPPAGSYCQFLSRAGAASGLEVGGIVGHGRRLGLAYRAPTTNQFGVYVQSPLTPGRQVTLPKSFAFSDLDYALYLGRRPGPGSLLEATTSQLPITGRQARSSFPFGNTELTLVGTPTQPLSGTLSRRLALIVAILGVVLSVGAALLTQRLVRRRWSAEALASENRRLYAEQASIAGTLQQALLPKELPVIDGLELGARYVAGLDALEVGGDWYDVFRGSDGRTLFVVGDVSGKGLAAAALMASLQHAIRAYAAEGQPPAAILSGLCRLLDVSRDGHFATILCGSVDTEQGVVTLASAGHLPPLVMTRSGVSFAAVTVGPPIGIESRSEYASLRLTVPDGATLLAFTDGLIERRGQGIDEGLDQLRQVAGAADRSLDDLLGALISELTPEGSDDDIAVLALRWVDPHEHRPSDAPSEVTTSS